MTLVTPGEGSRINPRNSLTLGKHYEVLSPCGSVGFRIKDDDGAIIFCLWSRCAYLQGGSWFIVPESEVPARRTALSPEPGRRALEL